MTIARISDATRLGQGRTSADGPMQLGRRAVKDELRSRGVKVWHVSMAERTAQARVWMAAHQEEVAEAKARAAKMGYSI